MSSHVLSARECLIGERHNAEIKTVSELVSASKIFVEDGNHGENRPRQDEFCHQGNGIPFLRPPDLKEGRVDFRNCDFINAQGFARVRKGIGKPGDVILTHRATVGRIAITGSDAPTVFVTNPGTTIWRSLDKDLLDQRYLYFYMSSRIFQDRLFSEVGHTSTFDYVSLTQQRTLPVVIPEIRIQRQIAHILGTLDDKIELNRKTNETLEAMAKALFKSWFVDFDPVRAKAEGRPTGLPDEISDLFPDSFEDSELGEIPSGWKNEALYDLADYINGASHSSEHLNGKGKGLPVIKINELKYGITGQTKNWDHEYNPKHLIGEGDILFSWSGNPDTSIGTFVWSKGKGLLNQHIFKVSPKCLTRRSFLLLLLKHNQTLFANIARDKQTTGLGHVTIRDLKETFCSLPCGSLMKAFARIVNDLISRQQILSLQSDTLSRIRDTLLPKLISGEIRIPDAEKMLEEVGI